MFSVANNVTNDKSDTGEYRKFSSANDLDLQYNRGTINPSKCSGVRQLHLKVFNAIHV